MGLVIKILVALALAALAYRIISAFARTSAQAAGREDKAHKTTPKTIATDLELCPRCKTYVAKSETHACARPGGPQP